MDDTVGKLGDAGIAEQESPQTSLLANPNMASSFPAT